MTRFPSPLCRFLIPNDKSQGKKNKTGLKRKNIKKI